MIDVVVEGRPVPKERPRVANGRAFTPRATSRYEDTIAWTVKGKYPGLKVDADKNWCVAVTFVLGDRRKRDLDNLAKSVMDGLNGVVYQDDSQVVKLKAAKRYVKGAWRTMVTAWPE